MFNARIVFAAAAVLAVSACNSGSAVSPVAPAAPTELGQAASPGDSTSILKQLKKNVVIGSTVDPGNGDQGPRGVSLVHFSYGLKKNQLALCNYENAAGTAGKGTTVEIFDPKPGSSPTSLATSAKLAGCSDTVVSNNNTVYATALTSDMLVSIAHNGNVKSVGGKVFKQPFYITDASCKTADLPLLGPAFCGYSAEYLFTSDATTGAIVSFSINQYGNKHQIQVGSGFAVNKKTGWSTLGPSGLAYSSKKDELYIADGVTNTIVLFTHASELLVKDEIVVKADGKSFTCKYPKTTCGKLVLAGKPLNAPVAMALLPNGNLVVANGAGGNTLVELTTTGTVLATKVVDKSKTSGVFGLVATGKTDTDTTLFYTDANDNTLHELIK
jgi:hypothetical protein